MIDRLVASESTVRKFLCKESGQFSTKDVATKAFTAAVVRLSILNYCRLLVNIGVTRNLFTAIFYLIFHGSAWRTESNVSKWAARAVEPLCGQPKPVGAAKTTSSTSSLPGSTAESGSKSGTIEKRSGAVGGSPKKEGEAESSRGAVMYEEGESPSNQNNGQGSGQQGGGASFSSPTQDGEPVALDSAPPTTPKTLKVNGQDSAALKRVDSPSEQPADGSPSPIKKLEQLIESGSSDPSVRQESVSSDEGSASGNVSTAETGNVGDPPVDPLPQANTSVPLLARDGPNDVPIGAASPDGSDTSGKAEVVANPAAQSSREVKRAAKGLAIKYSRDAVQRLLRIAGISDTEIDFFFGNGIISIVNREGNLGSSGKGEPSVALLNAILNKALSSNSFSLPDPGAEEDLVNYLNRVCGIVNLEYTFVDRISAPIQIPWGRAIMRDLYNVMLLAISIARLNRSGDDDWSARFRLGDIRARLASEDREDSINAIQGVADAKEITTASSLFSFLNANDSFSKFIIEIGIVDVSGDPTSYRDSECDPWLPDFDWTSDVKSKESSSAFVLYRILLKAMDNSGFTLPDCVQSAANPVAALKNAAECVGVRPAFNSASWDLFSLTEKGIGFLTGADKDRERSLRVQKALQCAVEFAKLAKNGWDDDSKFRSLCVEWCNVLGLK
jgi:hypothetical protein